MLGWVKLVLLVKELCESLVNCVKGKESSMLRFSCCLKKLGSKLKEMRHPVGLDRDGLS